MEELRHIFWMALKIVATGLFVGGVSLRSPAMLILALLAILAVIMLTRIPKFE